MEHWIIASLSPMLYLVGQKDLILCRGLIMNTWGKIIGLDSIGPTINNNVVVGKCVNISIKSIYTLATKQSAYASFKDYLRRVFQNKESLSFYKM